MSGAGRIHQRPPRPVACLREQPTALLLRECPPKHEPSATTHRPEGRRELLRLKLPRKPGEVSACAVETTQATTQVDTLNGTASSSGTARKKNEFAGYCCCDNYCCSHTKTTTGAATTTRLLSRSWPKTRGSTAAPTAAVYGFLEAST